MKNFSFRESVVFGIALGASMLFLIAATPIKNLVFQGNADAAGYQITNLATGTNGSNAATLGYVTNQIDLAGTNYATSAQGALADSAVQPGDVIPLTDGGTGATNAADARAALDLGTAATSNATAFATASQGELADDLASGNATAAMATNAGSADWAYSASNAEAGSNLETAINGKAASSLTISTTAPLTGGNNLTANLTLGIAAATTNGTGAVQLATSNETITGTDSGKSVVPSGLAAWWTWLKTQAQTITAIWTFPSSIAFEGATTDAYKTTLLFEDPTANCTITVPKTTGRVVLDTSGADDYAAVGSGWGVFEASDFNNWTTITANGSGAALTAGKTWQSVQLQPGDTNGAYVGIRRDASVWNFGNFESYINWTYARRQTYAVRLGSMAADSKCWIYFGVPNSYTTGDPVTKGIGFRIIKGSSGNPTVEGITHNGTTLLATSTSNGTNTILLEWVYPGSGSVSFYMNGSSIGTLTGPTSTSSDMSLCFSTTKTATSANGWINLFSVRVQSKYK